MKSNARSTVLEPLTPHDREQLVRLWTEMSVRIYLGGALSRDEAEARADSVIAEASNAWAIRNRVEHGERLLGLVTFGTLCDLHELEVSYLLLPEYCGRGCVSPAVARACELAFATRNASRVIAETQTANAASIRLLERLGFEQLYECERFDASQAVYALAHLHAELRKARD